MPSRGYLFDEPQLAALDAVNREIREIRDKEKRAQEPDIARRLAAERE